MIICPNCNHQNPEVSAQCEKCYSPLPSTSPCPNCGAMVQLDATFCGQCGFNLQSNSDTDPSTSNGKSAFGQIELENLTAEKEFSAILQEEPTRQAIQLDNLNDPFASNEQIEEISENGLEDDDLEAWLASMQEESSPQASGTMDLTEEIPGFSSETSAISPEPPSNLEANQPTHPEPSEILVTPPTDDVIVINQPLVERPELLSTTEKNEIEAPKAISENPQVANPQKMTNSGADSTSQPIPQQVEAIASEKATAPPVLGGSSTRLQLQKAALVHVQTGLNLEIPPNLDIVRMGKPNSQVPPDIDVSGFPNAEIVSRVHADIRVEGDTYFIEDRGSSNGTYVNHSPLLSGNRHRLRQGDRVSLGKGDLMSFIFQVKQV